MHNNDQIEVLRPMTNILLSAAAQPLTFTSTHIDNTASIIGSRVTYVVEISSSRNKFVAVTIERQRSQSQAVILLRKDTWRNTKA